MTFSSPDGSVTFSVAIIGFVDDTTCITSGDPSKPLADMLHQIQEDAQLWNDLLWSSDGCLELPKCGYHTPYTTDFFLAASLILTTNTHTRSPSNQRTALISQFGRKIFLLPVKTYAISNPQPALTKLNKKGLLVGSYLPEPHAAKPDCSTIRFIAQEWNTLYHNNIEKKHYPDSTPVVVTTRTLSEL